MNHARQVLFSQKGTEIEKIPSMQDVLMQHLLRVGNQDGHVWGQALPKTPHLPSPSDFDCTRKGDMPGWEVLSMTLPSTVPGWEVQWMTLPSTVPGWEVQWMTLPSTVPGWEVQ